MDPRDRETPRELAERVWSNPPATIDAIAEAVDLRDLDHEREKAALRAEVTRLREGQRNKSKVLRRMESETVDRTAARKRLVDDAAVGADEVLG